MALWLLALQASLVVISVGNGAAASSEPLHLGSILLLPTNAEPPKTHPKADVTIPIEPPIEHKEAPIGPQTDPAGTPNEAVIDDSVNTLPDREVTTNIEELISADFEQITDKIEVTGSTLAEDEGVNPDLGSSQDLITNSYYSGHSTDSTADKLSEIDHETEILGAQDTKTSGKTHVETNIFEPDAEEIAEFVDDGEGGPSSLHPVLTQQSLFVHREKVFEGPICSETIEQEEGTITVAGDLVDSECTGFAWTVIVGGDYSADVTLKSLNVSEVNGEFMIIGPGSSAENLWDDESNPIFTAVIKKERKFRILESKNFTVFLVTNSPGGFQGGFSISYKRAVMVGTTTPSTTPAPTLPTPGANITSVITVFLGGKKPKEFVKILDQFRGVVANMANQYSSDNNIEMSEVPTYENVVVSLVTQCDFSWPHSETCVMSNMSVALITPNDDPLQFELTADHLQDMWDTMAATNTELTDLGVYVYIPPNATATMFLWVGISLGVLVIFLVFLLIVWRVEVIRDYARMTNKQESVSGRESTMSRASEWFPTGSQHQLVPPFMDVYSEVGYVEYEPEFNGPAPVSKYQTPTIVTPIPTYEPPPKYGPPSGFGGAVHFYGNTMKHFDNDAFEEDDEHEAKEEEINTSQIKYQLSGILKNAKDTDNSTC